MAWIESHQSLLKHPKTTAMIGLLGVDRHKLIGHLMALWWWAIDIADADGNLPGSCTEYSIAEAAGWPLDDADQFIRALVGCGGRKKGFIEQKRGRFTLHDWNNYTSRLYKLRNARAEAGRLGGIKSGEARRKQTRSKREANARSNEAPTNQPTNQTNQTNQTNLDQRLDLVAARFARFGRVTSGTPAAIEESATDHSIEWVEKAVSVASGAAFEDAPSWNYVESILERWKANGGPDEPRATNAKTQRHAANGGSGGSGSSDDIAAGWLAEAGRKG
jgi:hypothetical protein